MHDPAGQAQGFTEGGYRLGVPPAFFRRPHPVFNMDNPQIKAPRFPEMGQGKEHGGGIGPTGNRRKQGCSGFQGT
jgi:hypothetical protein